MNDILAREVFKTSRLADFASERELIAQTGHPLAEWPTVVVKELVDNAIDACEDSRIAPVVQVEIDTRSGTFTVTDNGPGISAEVVDGLVDYSYRVSSREAYVSPSRGRQGNALQTLLAMAYVLDQECGETLIEARGVAHRIRFEIDRVVLEPRVSITRSASLVKTGSRLTLIWPATACHVIEAAAWQFLPIVDAYDTFNPHVSLRFVLNGAVQFDYRATDPSWTKWRGSDPLPPHWFGEQDFTR